MEGIDKFEFKKNDFKTRLNTAFAYENSWFVVRQVKNIEDF